MTYRIEITADSLNELAGRVLAMAAQFQTTEPQPVIIVSHRGKDEVAVDPVMPEVKQAAVGEPTPGLKSAPIVEASESQQETIPTPVDISPAAAPSPSSTAKFSYHDDVVPRVLHVVQTKGRDAMEAVLGQFGVSRAREVPEEQWGELIDLLIEVAA